MEITPQGTSEDSGYHTRTIEYSSNFQNYSTYNALYLDTPTIPSNLSRKRKLVDRFSTQNLYFQTPTVADNRPDFLSSTLNESLTRSLEKCIIGNSPIQFTPIELDVERNLKRCKLDDYSSDCLPKTRSAPTTPTKQLEESGLSYKSESEPSEYKLSDRKKNYHRYAKLGSPERLELLYPNLKLVKTPLKLRTPEKLREFIKKINSPAKKRLFEHKQSDRRVIKKLDCDPVSVFLVKNDFRYIISKIFSYLPDSDLYMVSKVSKSWKRALTGDLEAFSRFYSYSQKNSVNKENVTPGPVIEKTQCLDSLEQDYFNRCRKMAAQLTPAQSLRKCLQCMQPSVIEQSISQCQNPNCQYIYCIKCLCFSTSGPENFVDKCQTSELIINKSKTTTYSEYLDESLDRFQSKPHYDSSGYISESDISPAERNLNLTMNMKRLPVLQEVNRNSQRSAAYQKNRQSSLCSVISSNSSSKIDIIEPSSPPKIKSVACSKQSKKNLKRLQF